MILISLGAGLLALLLVLFGSYKLYGLYVAGLQRAEGADHLQSDNSGTQHLEYTEPYLFGASGNSSSHSISQKVNTSSKNKSGSTGGSSSDGSTTSGSGSAAASTQDPWPLKIPMMGLRCQFLKIVERLQRE